MELRFWALLWGGTSEILSGFNDDLLFRDTSPEALADGIMSAVVEYLTDTAKYNSMRKRCREYITQKYTWDIHAFRLEKIIQEAISIAAYR